MCKLSGQDKDKISEQTIDSYVRITSRSSGLKTNKSRHGKNPLEALQSLKRIQVLRNSLFDLPMFN
ncbi:hypothetical protein E2C01_024272 [Portunus trituberculatus]|uniref:Uncharacterized protein n=1 Tax=Portunus trituberculatus TaxID=210409 RepID=A0A5B7ECE4_PORTR|nr:hypothetical protein [Portunus trituberculatus]